jgi:NAD(P)-dependent dehydrogenase (short-subunit alcohol dehydrogenase family)
MNIDLTGQAAVVTGAGHGIGLAVTRALTASGAHVIAGTRHSCVELDQLAAEGTVTTFEVDLAAPGPAELAAWSPTW